MEKPHQSRIRVAGEGLHHCSWCLFCFLELALCGTELPFHATLAAAEVAGFLFSFCKL